MYRVYHLDVFFGVVKQTCAETHLVIVGFQDLEVSAALATLPEFGVVCECGEGHRPEAEFIVHLHYGCAGGDAEDLRVREFLS